MAYVLEVYSTPSRPFFSVSSDTGIPSFPIGTKLTVPGQRIVFQVIDATIDVQMSGATTKFVTKLLVQPAVRGIGPDVDEDHPIPWPWTDAAD